MDIAEGCRRLFAARPQQRDFGTYIDQNAPDCQCEHHSVSDGPYGPVGSAESMARLVFSSDLQPDGTIAMHVFASSIGNGLSLQRLDFASPPEIAQVVSAILSRLRSRRGTTVEWIGSTMAEGRILRAIKKPDGNSAFCLYDTAEAENPSHAELFQTVDPKDRSTRSRLKDELAKLFGTGPREHVRADSFMDGQVLAAVAGRFDRAKGS